MQFKSIQIVALLLIVAGTVTGQGVVINECFTGVPDWCEVINLSGASVNIGGMTLVMTDDQAGGVPAVANYTFPAGTTLASGEIAVVSESATGPLVPSTVQFFVSATNINWAGPTNPNDPNGGCGLNDAAGAGIDLVLFGSPVSLPAQTPPSTFTGILPPGDVVARNILADTDDASDWTSSTGGTGTPGSLNPGQSSGPPTAGFTSAATSVAVGSSVQFQDLSTGGPSAWQWDLDGDGVTDSTVQSPLFTYSAAGSYDVTLVVSNSFGSDSVTVANYMTVVTSGAVGIPYIQDFNSGSLGTEWVLNSEPNGQIVIGTDGDPSPLSGGDAMLMDAIVNGTLATNRATLTIDLGSTGGGILKYYFKESLDEDHPEDGVFLSDGVNTVLISNHNGAAGTWTEFSVDLTAAAASNGIALTTSNTLVFSQRDNFAIPTDGAHFDDIRITGPPVPDTGQANQPLAYLDVNGGLNVNGNPATVGENGPFNASGNAINMTVTGEPNQAYLVLFSATLTRANATFGAVGQLDLGSMGAGNLSDIVIVLDGASGAGFFDQFARTDVQGFSSLTFGMSNQPLGLFGSIQAAVFNSTPQVAGLTAAFEFTVTP